MTETMLKWGLKFQLVHKADVKLALGVGVTLQPSITVDLKPVQKHIVAPVTNAAKATGNAISKGAKKLKFW
jgi:hypothetical protein